MDASLSGDIQFNAGPVNLLSHREYRSTNYANEVSEFEYSDEHTVLGTVVAGLREEKRKLAAELDEVKDALVEAHHELHKRDGQAIAM